MTKELVIAISGLPGTGSTSVAKELAKRLGLKYFSPGEYFKSQSKGKESIRALEVWRSEIGKKKGFHEEIDKSQIKKAKAGGIVICGKLSIHKLRDIADFKFWIESPLDVRAERAAHRDKIPKENAIKLLRDRERIEREEWKRLYGIDYFTQKGLADLIVDTSNKSLEASVNEILDFIRMGTYVEFLKPLEKKLRKIKKRGLTITIAGLSESGKSTISKSLAREFNLRYIFAGEIQRQLAKENGISLEEQARMRGAEVDYEMDRRSLKFAIGGKVVIDGRLSGWVAGDWADVKIFVKCSIRTRAKRITRRENTTLKKAMAIIRKRDKIDTKRYKQLYDIDQFDTSIYDIIINNNNLTLKQTRAIPIRLVRRFLRKRKKRK